MTLHYSQHRISLGDRPRLYRHRSNPLCCICNKPVPLETSKTDEHGRAIHGECYLLKLHLRHAAKVPKLADE